MNSNVDILILGHGRKYKPTYIRCSPIPIEDWYYASYTCVDINPKVHPDIVYDLEKNINNWTFTSSAHKYTLIIDTCGCLFYNGHDYPKKFLRQIDRYLNQNGVFYGRNNYIYTKASKQSTLE
jgi:hypothetical protein